MTSLYVTEDDLPEIKNWKVGETYKIILTVKQTSLSQGGQWDTIGTRNSKYSARFDIINAKPQPEKEINSMSTNDFNKLKGNVYGGQKNL